MLVILLMAPVTSWANGLDVYGTFLTQKKNSHIQIADCGDGTPCGTVVWISPDSLEEGMTAETAVNKAGKKVLGLTILEGFDARKKDWRGGKIYDPEADKTYKSIIKRLDDGALQVKGCIAFFCQTQVWTQVIEQSNNETE